jgi:nitrogen regulatory protein PII
VQAIQRAAHTGNPGDGCIFVLPIEMTLKIRTDEMSAHQ